jgi:gas vesicle protein
MKGEKPMRYLLSFLSGVFVGAAVALLYAPKSGEELRGQIRTQAEIEFEKAQVEWQRMQQQMSAKLDETVAEVRELIEQVQAGEAAEGGAEVVEVEVEVEAPEAA